MIKIFKKKPGKSEKLVLSTREVLALHGIVDKKTQDEICNIFFRANAEVMQAILKKRNLDKILERETEQMRGALIMAGIMDAEIQDAIVLKYFQIILDIAGVKQ